MSLRRLLNRFRQETRASLLPVFGVSIFVTVVAVGAAIDYGNAARKKSILQDASDTALLAVARSFDPKVLAFAYNDEVDAFVAANVGTLTGVERQGDVEYVAATSELCVGLVTISATSFVKVIGVPDLPVRTRSCVQVEPGVGPMEYEIALVTDVSASVGETGRMVPLKQALDTFVRAFSEDEIVRERTRIALVPYANRVNIGVGRTSWLVSHEGLPAVPDRWTRPREGYDSRKYDEIRWIDGVTRGYVDGPVVHWLGCIEPRSDVAMKVTGAVNTDALGDAPPSAIGLVAMDSNPWSPREGCPPPIVGLTGDLDLIRAGIGALTAQGSSRLDAGLAAGWYAISPRWTGLWGEEARPLPVSGNVRKAVVVMTDSHIETEHGQTEGVRDWLCEGDAADSCNATAEAQFLRICASLKGTGVEIYTVAYDAGADEASLRRCASGSDHAFRAFPSAASAHSIVSVYRAIAEDILETSVRLTQ